MKTSAEPWSFPQSTLDLVDSVAADMRPSDPNLRDWFATYRSRHRLRFAADLDLVSKRLPPNARILEYGAVPPIVTAALAKLRYEVSGLDIAPERFADAFELLGLDVRRCDVEKEPAPFGDASFDAVLFNEIFEHLRIDPIFTLSEALRVLKPNGRIFLSTPNLRSLRGIKNLLLHNQGHASSAGVHRQYEKLRTLGHMGHVREYTTFEVADFLTKVGFVVEEAVFRGGHGRGPVGLVERLAPSLRPFFSLIARKPRGGDAA